LPELVVLTLDQDYQQVAGTESRKTHFQRQLRVDVANAISVDMLQVLLLLLLRMRREGAREREKERKREGEEIRRWQSLVRVVVVASAVSSASLCMWCVCV